jgi:hypothetical protein
MHGARPDPRFDGWFDQVSVIAAITSGVSIRRGLDPIAAWEKPEGRIFSRLSKRSEAKQSIGQQKESWIASSRSLSSGARSRDLLAPRNDGKLRPWRTQTTEPGGCSRRGSACG